MAKQLSRKDKIKYIAIAVAVVAVLIFYIVSVKNGNGDSELAQSLLESVVGEDTANLINGYTGVGGNGDESSTVAIIDDDSDEADEPANEPKATPTPKPTEEPEDNSSADYVEYRFRNNNLLSQHYDKHGKEMGFKSKEAYEKAASDVINNPDALHKIEAEDGDYVYYVEATNEFVILSTDGYIRTYFLPNAGLAYYNRQ